MKYQKKKRQGRSWCGPLALTVIAGCTYEEAEEAIFDARSGLYLAPGGVRRVDARYSPSGRKRSIRGVHHRDLEQALYSLGVEGISRWQYTYEGHTPPDRRTLPTLARWLRERERRGLALVLLKQHVLVVTARKGWEASTPPTGQWIRQLHGRRRRVEGWLDIHGKDE